MAIPNRARALFIEGHPSGPAAPSAPVGERGWRSPERVDLVSRSRGTAKSDTSGVGHGLYISRCIVEAYGGRIWAESRLREGSTFYFTLLAAKSVRTAALSRT